MIEAVTIPKTSVNIYLSVVRSVPEDGHFQTRRCDNLKSHLKQFNCLHCPFILPSWDSSENVQRRSLEVVSVHSTSVCTSCLMRCKQMTRGSQTCGAVPCDSHCNTVTFFPWNGWIKTSLYIFLVDFSLQNLPWKIKFCRYVFEHIVSVIRRLEQRCEKRCSWISLWVATPRRLAGRSHRFGGRYCLHFQGRRCRHYVSQ